jgi:Na+-transporting NADH:ubiquinone oxidoreductase subunit C
VPPDADNSASADTATRGGLQPNTVTGTLLVATVLCLVCSLMVAGTAVALRSKIEENKRLNRQRNVLIAAGLFDANTNSAADIPKLFEQVKTIAVALPDRSGNDEESGRVVDMPAEVPVVSIPPDLDLGGIKTRETVAEVYIISNGDGRVAQLVLPVRGKGLWSTLKGYISLQADVAAGLPVGGITFYEHAETPGLGGEVDNRKWKDQWSGKQLFNANWQPDLVVTKPDVASAANEVDGMSGATVTSVGVQNLVNYWLGPDGFGPFLERYRNGELDL